MPAVLLKNWRLIAAGAALVAAAGLGWTVNGWRLEQRIAEIQRDHASLRAEASRRTVQAQATQRAIEAAREAAKQETDHVSTLARARADDDRRAADAAGRRLLDAARAAAARASGAGQDSTTAGQCTPADGGPVRALVDVLGEADAAAGELAAALDHARAAGLGCQRYVDTLSTTAGPPGAPPTSPP